MVFENCPQPGAQNLHQLGFVVHGTRMPADGFQLAANPACGVRIVGDTGYDPGKHRQEKNCSQSEQGNGELVSNFGTHATCKEKTGAKTDGCLRQTGEAGCGKIVT